VTVVVFNVVGGVSPIGFLLQGESVVRGGGGEVVIDDFEPGVLEDPKVPEKAGLPPLDMMGGVKFFSVW
jgi:hypothetical protein